MKALSVVDSEIDVADDLDEYVPSPDASDSEISGMFFNKSFNKIAIRNNKFQMASGQGSHWLIESPTIFSSMCSLPLSISDICQFYF